MRAIGHGCVGRLVLVGRRQAGKEPNRGSLSAFVVLLTVALVAVVGLVACGGQLLSAREAALSEAEQAARAGAAVVSAQALRSGRIADGGEVAIQAAEQVMAEDGHPGSASAEGTEVTVVVTPYPVPTPLLSLVGISSLHVSASASAQAVAG